MKTILKDYYQIFLSCPIGGLMQAERTRMAEKVKLWSKKTYEEIPTLDEVKNFIDMCSCPIFPEFVERILQPIIKMEKEQGKTAAQEYKKELIEDGTIIEEV